MCFPVFEAKRTFRRIWAQRAFHGGAGETGTYHRISKIGIEEKMFLFVSQWLSVCLSPFCSLAHTVTHIHTDYTHIQYNIYTGNRSPSLSLRSFWINQSINQTHLPKNITKILRNSKEWFECFWRTNLVFFLLKLIYLYVKT